MIRVPGKGSPGGRCERLVELVDLYPTLCDVAGVPIPEEMEGASLKPLLKDPKQEWKATAFSQFHRNPRVTPDEKRYMGYSMVTSRYHYVEWYFWDHEAELTGDRAAVELYDLKADPDENTNIANDPNNQQLVEKLSEQLKTSWPIGGLPTNRR